MAAQPHALLELARRQHGGAARSQLVAQGWGRGAIEQALRSGRLHPIHRGVYAVGRPDLTDFGRWLAGVLAARPDGVLSHRSAAALWGIRPWPAMLVVLRFTHREITGTPDLVAADILGGLRG